MMFLEIVGGEVCISEDRPKNFRMQDLSRVTGDRNPYALLVPEYLMASALADQNKTLPFEG
jgi:hypothetical protein